MTVHRGVHPDSAPPRLGRCMVPLRCCCCCCCRPGLVGRPVPSLMLHASTLPAALHCQQLRRWWWQHTTSPATPGRTARWQRAHTAACVAGAPQTTGLPLSAKSGAAMAAAGRSMQLRRRWSSAPAGACEASALPRKAPLPLLTPPCPPRCQHRPWRQTLLRLLPPLPWPVLMLVLTTPFPPRYRHRS